MYGGQKISFPEEKNITKSCGKFWHYHLNLCLFIPPSKFINVGFLHFSILILIWSGGIVERRFKRQCWTKQEHYSLFIVKTVWRSWDCLALILWYREKKRPCSFEGLCNFSCTYAYNFPDACFFSLSRTPMSEAVSLRTGSKNPMKGYTLYH